jgi:hypothetical protein
MCAGNSRLLVEEEKFRKAGKKKYEVLSEKMLQLFAKLNTLTGASTTSAGGPAPHIDVRPTLAALSAKGKGLLKGRFKERIELMHLQLSTGPAAAAVASTVSPTVSASSIPVSSSHTPAVPLGLKPKKGMYAAHPPTPPTNVFDFSNSHNEVPRAHSGDAHTSVEKGISLTGRASNDSVGTANTEKENRA